MRSKVWQLMHSISGRFCSRRSRHAHEPFGIGELGGKIGGLAQLDRDVGRRRAEIDAFADRQDRSRRRGCAARNVPATAGRPESGNGRCSSLTTVTVIGEPSFCALTSTPSIAPSSADVTEPVSVCASAGRCLDKSEEQRCRDQTKRGLHGLLLLQGAIDFDRIFGIGLSAARNTLACT